MNTKKLLASDIAAVLMVGGTVTPIAQEFSAVVPYYANAAFSDLVEGGKTDDGFEYLIYGTYDLKDGKMVNVKYEYAFVYNYKGKKTAVTVPDKILGCPVTEIGTECFKDNSSLVSVKLPDTLISIDGGKHEFLNGTGGAFEDCKNLVKIDIPSSVETIGDWAFCGCSSLSKLTLSENLTTIGLNAFCGCEKLTSLKIPDNVLSLGDYAFKGCSALTSVEFGSSLMSMGIDAFSNCTSLKSIEIPPDMTVIPDGCFSGCKNLTSVKFPESLSAIKSYAFSDTGLLKAELPENITVIESGMFAGCENLTEVVISDNVTIAIQ